MLRGSTGNLTPPSRMATTTPLDVDIALVTIGNIDILRDVVGSPKTSQGGF